MTVEEMKAVDIRTVDKDALVDIRDMKIDRTLPKEERIRSFVEQIKNPYCFKVNIIPLESHLFLASEPSISYLRATTTYSVDSLIDLFIVITWSLTPNNL